MRFKISTKDLIIFIVFCIVLLYLCGIGVINFVTFGSTGKPAGLNPFPAFTGTYLPITLILFVIALIMIFSSVSSFIFEKDGKGFGIVLGDKEEKGYSRWAKDKEIKKDMNVEVVDSTQEKTEYAGVPLCMDKNKIWVDNGEYHTLVIGASGSGKSRFVVKPLVNLLAKKGESMIVTDPKGELYIDAAEHLRSVGYNVIVLNFRDPIKGNAWNPLTLPYQYSKMGNKDKATELLDDVALNILYDPNNKGEPFWEKSAADFFSGLALGLFEDAKEDEINLNSINVMSTVGEERLGASNYTKEYFTMKGESSAAYTFASNTINSPTETKGGILSTFRQKIRLFASRENLSEMLGHSDFNMLDIGKGKTAVFIIIHDEKTTYHALATIFIKQCYETLVDVAQENGGRLPIRTNFILDEFANMPPLKDVDSMVTAARSRSMRFTFIIQNFAQLNDVYGKEVAEVIRGNCGNTIYIISTELAALEEISKMCGEVKSKDKDKTASTPLVTVTDLQKLKFGEAILMRVRNSPFKTKLPWNDKINWGYNVVPASFKARDSKPVQIFDIKTFVKEKKKEKMLSNIDGAPKEDNMNMNPFGNIGGMNPFANLATPSTPEPAPVAPNGMFGGLGDNIDLDAMMRDIDKKIAELDAEEAKQKASGKTDDHVSDIKSEQVIKPSYEVNESNIDVNPVKIVEEPKINLEAINAEVKPSTISVDSYLNRSLPSEEDIKKSYSNNDSKTGQTSFNFDIPTKVIDQETIMDSKPIMNNTSMNNSFMNNNMMSNTPMNNNMMNNNMMNNAPTNSNPILDDIDKPKINVDADSVVVNSNISDDEFFDDFFGEDDN